MTEEIAIRIAIAALGFYVLIGLAHNHILKTRLRKMEEERDNQQE